MAVLPDVTDVARGPSAVSGRILAPPPEDNRGNAMIQKGEGIKALGAGVAALGRGIGAALERRQAEAGAVTLAQAQAGMNTDLMNITNRYSLDAGDTDYATWQERAGKDFEASLEKWGGTISDPKERAIFEADYGQRIVKTNLAIGDAAAAQGRGVNLANADESLTALARSALEASSTEEAMAAITQAHDLIDKLEGTGALSAAEAIKKRGEVARSFAMLKATADADNDPASAARFLGGDTAAAAEASSFLKSRLNGGHAETHITGMDRRLQARLASFISSAPPGIREHITIVSGYRSVARQAELYKMSGGSGMVAPPGRSKHNHGQAADLGWKGGGLRSAPPEAIAWMKANAGRFGLDLPLDGVRTKIREDWHVELVEARGGSFGGVAGEGAINPTIQAAGAKYGVPAHILQGVWMTESSGGKNMLSPKGAAGHMGFMPGTWAQYGNGGDVNDLVASSDAAARYLVDLKRQFGSWEYALMAYNWGPGNMQNWLAGHATMPEETREYVAKVMASGAGGPIAAEAPAYYQLLGPDEILKLRDRASANLAAADREAAAAFAADKADAIGGYRLGIESGSIKSATDFLNDPRLDDGDRASLLSRFNEKNKEGAALSEAMARVQSGEGLNPYSSDDRKAASMFYNAIGGADGLAEGDPQAVARLQDTVTRTGVVPAEALNAIRNAIDSANPARAASALTAASGLYASNPAIFDAYDGGKSIAEASESFRHYTQDRGYSSLDAARKLIEARSPEARRSEAVLGKAADEYVDKLTAADVVAEFDSILPFDAPLAGATPGAVAVLEADYRDAVREAFIGPANGDPELARKLGLKTIRETYSVSTVNGPATIMRYAPELRYPPINGGHDYLRDLALKDAMAESGLPMSVEVDPRVGKPAVGTGIMGDGITRVELVPTGRETAADFKANVPPRYRLVYYRMENGQEIREESSQMFVATDADMQAIVETGQAERDAQVPEAREIVDRVQSAFDQPPAAFGLGWSAAEEESIPADVRAAVDAAPPPVLPGPITPEGVIARSGLDVGGRRADGTVIEPREKPAGKSDDAARREAALRQYEVSMEVFNENVLDFAAALRTSGNDEVFIEQAVKAYRAKYAPEKPR